MEQLAACAVGLVAQVEVMRDYFGCRLETQAPLLCLQVALQRHSGCLWWDFTEPLANLQSIADQLHRLRIAITEHGLDSLMTFRKPWHGKVAYGGERLAEPHSLDYTGGRGIQSLFAQEVRCMCHPANGYLVGCRPQVLIPARRSD